MLWFSEPRYYSFVAIHVYGFVVSFVFHLGPRAATTTPGRMSSKRNNKGGGGSRFGASSVQLQFFPSSSTPLQITVDDAVFENSGIFAKTPFRKSLESPSAWMSHWFSFVPGPRVDTGITIEVKEAMMLLG
ncbi:unnamed protein product [Lactuca virosa]|uniref:Uncharacterized protein n=1 Tax=Lactuca virosa TaxID=75947 RepID=A0AAU9M8U9_9ASTR|nr:unnamed protein product [Lactuca virosa]